VNDDNIRYLK